MSDYEGRINENRGSFGEVNSELVAFAFCFPGSKNGIDTPARKVELNHSVAKQLQV